MPETKTMTEDQLKALIVNVVTEQFKAQGAVITEALKEQIEGVVVDTLKNKVDIKSMFKEEDKTPKTDPKAGFKCFSEFAMAVRNSEVSKGRVVDDRLLKLEKDVIEKAAGTSLRAQDAEYGGYLIPEDFRNTLLEIAVKQSNIMQMCQAIPMAINSVNIPYVQGFDRSSGTLHGGVEFKWLDEEGQKQESRPKFGRIAMKLHKLAGLVYASDEILEDSPISLEPLLTRMFADQLTYQLENTFLNGSGAGKPLGILNAPCLITVDAESNQVATTIMFENIINMYSRMWQKGSAIWMANEDTLPQLAAMSLAVGTGGIPVWMPAGGISGAPYDTLMGRPLIFNEHCQTLGTKGDILFCDWSQYLVGQKAGDTGVKFASSIHLKFDYDQTCFRFVFRIDGQPWWPTYITPRNSSKTLSPFVSLATRS